MRKLQFALLLSFFAGVLTWFMMPEESSGYEEEYEHGLDFEENEMEAGRKREYYEWYISRDPRTNTLPKDIRKMELEWVEQFDRAQRRSGIQNVQINNVYNSVGPSRYGGRTRALAFDVRYNGTSNRVVIAGGVQGGIFRSEDGGLSWTFVHPPNDVRSVTCVAQDTRPGFQDTWYAGSGEASSSSSWPNATVFGHGVFKSTDNGRTWARLPSTFAGNNEFVFDGVFDFCHNMTVHPVTGDVYVAGHRRLMRSSDGGNSWEEALVGTQPATFTQGQTDILINRAGTRLFAAVSGEMPDRDFVGVWTSPTGNPGTWIRIAGGQLNANDSIPGWRAFDNSFTDSTKGWGRTVLGLSANQNDLYVLIENRLPSSTREPTADLFRADISATPITWSANLGSNLRARFNGTQEVTMNTQGDYNMTLACHPTNNNLIFIGGVYLFRSTNGFNNSTNTLVGGFAGTRLGGDIVVSNTIIDPDLVAHPDYHKMVFDPSNPNRAIAATDGGISITPDCTAPTMSWANGNANYVTMQYYHAGPDPVVGSRTFVGGTQDNAINFRDQSNLFGPPPADSNSHVLRYIGDGCQTYLLRNASNQYFSIFGLQEQNIFRVPLFGGSRQSINIKPANTGNDIFVTYFHLDEDNPSNLYFPSLDTLYRTNSPLTVTGTSGWTRMSGIDNALSGAIFSMETTKGEYTPNSQLFIGTNGRLYRLRDPANTAPETAPVDITPPGMQTGMVIKDISVNPRNHDTLMFVVSNYAVQSVYWTGNATAATPTWQTIEGNVAAPSVRSCEIVATTGGVEYYIGTTVGLFATRTINGNSTNWTRETGGPGGLMNTTVVQSLSNRWRDNTLVVGTHSNGLFVANIGNAINIPTSVNDPIRDDKNFIVKAFPTITSNLINFETGSMLSIRNVQVQVFNLGGQILYNQSMPYRNGNVNVSGLPAGTYVLTITSPDRKYQFVRRFNKQ